MLPQRTKAVLVLNRADTALTSTLEKILNAEVRLAVVERPGRRAQNIASAVGGYDIVLIAEGFLDHVVADAIREAASKAAVPYLFVKKGRPAQVRDAVSSYLQRHAGPHRVSTKPSASSRLDASMVGSRALCARVTFEGGPRSVGDLIAPSIPVRYRALAGSSCAGAW